MEQLFQQFNNSYEQLLKNKKQVNEPTGKEFYNLGVYLYSNASGIELKNNILSKIIHHFPNEPEIHFYIGFTNKYTDRNKALFHYKKSFEFNPNNLENMIDLCNMLYENGDSKSVIEMDKNNFFNQFLHDDRFIILYTQSKIKEGYYENCLNYYLYLIDKYNKKNKKELTEKDREIMFSTHMNVAHLYSIDCNFEKSMFYSEKSIELSHEFNIDVKDSLKSFSNYLTFYDYEYYLDPEEYYKKALKINRYLPITSHFSFSKRNKDIIKIRVGYVSSDFTNHAVSNFVLPILKNHNRNQYEIYLYSNLIYDSPLYQRLSLPIKNICNISGLEVAKIIYNDQIDILIDLGGHTASNRLDVFSYNPAPIQVTYVGYPNTTGMTSIKYRITDSIADHVDTKQKYSEELIRLPNCFLIFESIIQNKPVETRKTSNKIVFGSLNKESKNTKYVLDAWKTILSECPNSILLIKIDTIDNSSERLKHYMEKLNVSKNRLLIMNQRDDDSYLKIYSMVDIVLDTFPYSGTTTTCNSLYNSIPLVTLYNKNYHSHNVSSSLLIHSGLSELVTYSKEEYINLVKKVATDQDLLNNYKKTIHDKFVKLMNPDEFMKGYEKALFDMYKKYTNETAHVERVDKITFQEKIVLENVQ